MAAVKTLTFTTANMNGAVLANWKQSVLRVVEHRDYAGPVTTLDYDTNYKPHKLSLFNTSGAPIEILRINNAEEEALYDACVTYADTVAVIGWEIIPANAFIDDGDNSLWAIAAKKVEGGANTTSDLIVAMKNYGPVY